MSSASLPTLPRRRPLDLALTVTLWLAANSALSLYLFARGDDRVQMIWALLLFFPLLLVRISRITVRLRIRRRANLVLIAAVGAWGSAGLWLYLADDVSLAAFPHPPELLFLFSYVGFAAHLLLDARSRHLGSWASWLESVVLCGGAACLAGALFLEPLARASGATGLALFTALLYPCLDISMLVVILIQVIVRARALNRSTVALLAGWLLFVAADSGFLVNVSNVTFLQQPAVGASLWFGGLLLMTANAARPVDVLPAGRRKHGAVPMLLAAASAIAVLIVRPLDHSSPYLVPIAVATLIAAAGRMTLALREANGAAEALALSRTDDLTLLPNRRAVLARIDHALGLSQPLALILFDLDGFKEINDTLGHGAGDTVLQIAANRVRESLPAESLVARLGGDEFAVVHDGDDEATLLAHARTVLASVSEPMTVEGMTLSVSASIGVSVASRKDVSSTDLLRRADVAMYQAKHDRSGVLIYDPDRDDFSRHKLQLAEDLRRGLAQGQLRVYYQPQVDAATRRLHGVEALIRWQHPHLGLLTPPQFLPVARRAGLMMAVSELVLAVAVADINRWTSRGALADDLRVSINCAPAELLSRTFLPVLFKACEQAAVPPDRLVVEVTEDSFLSEPGRARDILAEIRRHGVEISIDDYGTGFSSLSYLRDLPVNELKIDRSFIKALRQDPRSRTIVSSTVQMAGALGMRTVAEGVEDDETMHELTELGIDLLQGYGIGRPMPAEQLEGWLAGWYALSANELAGS
ncbi:bifunctional diguanylate cyclase/phosphodiesterase [Jatrophihabitans telluris]|uniref:Bifunctional diguanylate cyclase/phosphodiesterase n=1 Tax=Jatrophihabitans telluris TaxID=2038343 RepID=A0ABY4QXD4_9ACTN|nr:bifunctional diguanylate cyclase/phosphodiesterase [Jatrophihabitans telluris]UQX88346.1 bifunctional diguanylate cyclase/phosphodiesterase [Jatrophihabitans telluris]